MIKEAVVYRSTGSFYEVMDVDGKMWTARLKGRFRISSHIKSSNPIAVGDKVKIDVTIPEEPVISDISERDNYIIRTSPQNRHHKHIIASNLDLACLVVTAIQPVTSFGFIDRFLVTVEAFHIPHIIVINKLDLLEGESLEYAEDLAALYESIGIQVLFVSAETGEGIDALKEVMTNKRTLFTGHSGVGKTTLINQLVPSFGLRTGEVSAWSGKGQHTTTFAEMFDLPFGENSQIIDTPGIKEWGLQAVEQEELSHYFREMRELLNSCRFNNCLHLNEPQCAVKEALNNDELAESRYVNYLIFMDEIKKEW